MSRGNSSKKASARIYDSRSSGQAVFRTSQELFWGYSTDTHTESDTSPPPQNPQLMDVVRLLAQTILSSVPFKDQPELREKWGKCILYDLTIQEFMSGNYPHPPRPPSKEDTGALRDADAALRQLHTLNLAKSKPGALSGAEMETLIFMCAWVAGYCESSRHLRYFESAAHTGREVLRAASKGGKRRAKKTQKEHEPMLSRYREMLAEDPDISPSSAARKLVKEGFGGGRKFDTIRKKLSEERDECLRQLLEEVNQRDEPRSNPEQSDLKSR